MVCLCFTIRALFFSLCSWIDCVFNLCYFLQKIIWTLQDICFLYKTWYPTAWYPWAVTPPTFTVFAVAAYSLFILAFSLSDLTSTLYQYSSVLWLFASTVISSSISQKTYTHHFKKSGKFRSVTFPSPLLLSPKFCL